MTLAGGGAASAVGRAGDPDAAFGDEGFVTITSPDAQAPRLRDSLRGTPLRTGGVLIAASTTTEAFVDSQQLVMKLAPDGSYDDSFGTAGIAEVTLPGWSVDDGVLTTEEALPLAGGVLVGGTASVADLGYRDTLWLERLTARGRLDRDFAGNGVFRLQQPDLSYRQVTVVDDTVLVCGTNVRQSKLTVVRLDADGAPLPGFGVRGRVTLADGDHGRAVGCSRNAADETTVVQIEQHEFTLTRLTPAGALDTTFGEDGRITRSVPHDVLVTTAAIRANGRATILGMVDDEVPVVSSRKVNGKVDPAFGVDGFAEVELGDATFLAYEGDIALGPEGTLVLSGARLRSGHAEEAYVARLLADGSMDPSFGTAGLSDFEGEVTWFGRVDLYPDGRILAEDPPDAHPTTGIFVRLTG